MISDLSSGVGGGQGRGFPEDFHSAKSQQRKQRKGTSIEERACAPSARVRGCVGVRESTRRVRREGEVG